MIIWLVGGMAPFIELLPHLLLNFGNDPIVSCRKYIYIYLEMDQWIIALIFKLSELLTQGTQGAQGGQSMASRQVDKHLLLFVYTELQYSNDLLQRTSRNKALPQWHNLQFGIQCQLLKWTIERQNCKD